MYGRWLYQPYLASSKARSRYSIDGPMLVKPRNWSPRPGRAGCCGSPSSAKLTLDDVPWKRNRRMVSTRSVGSSRGLTSSRNVRRGSSALTTVVAWYSVPSARATPVARPFFVMTVSTGDSSTISAPNERAARASTWVNPPLPRLWKAHAPNSPSCSPIEWYSSTSPEPCEYGPTLVPMMLDEAR